MSTELGETAALSAARRLTDAANKAVQAAITAASELTQGGKLIDDHQVHVERIAQLATKARAAEELLAYAERQAAAGRNDALAEEQAFAFAAEAVHELRAAAELLPDAFGAEERLHDPDLRSLVRAGLADERIQSIGQRVLEARGAHATELDDPVATLTRDSARSFGKTEVLPLAQEIHRQDLLVPEALIEKMAGLGLFGASIPESYGGTEMGYLTMVVLTEELSAASLVAGSLITRSEILTRALLQGGTDEQKQHWLPRIATGELIVGICVTEPDIGSDV
ncbi:MAG: acyl-CoA dehydrogenase family protein, partial [Chloroflexi bacterium]|nr:acyl-CoA dehydrogenase family protein [Chloroflexota bacterium]